MKIDISGILSGCLTDTLEFVKKTWQNLQKYKVWPVDPAGSQLLVIFTKTKSSIINVVKIMRNTRTFHL